MADKALICEAHVRGCILEKVERLRPGWRCDRVSQKAINLINAKVRNIIIDSVRRHPTRGRTFTEVF